MKQNIEYLCQSYNFYGENLEKRIYLYWNERSMQKYDVLGVLGMRNLATPFDICIRGDDKYTITYFLHVNIDLFSQLLYFFSSLSFPIPEGFKERFFLLTKQLEKNFLYEPLLCLRIFKGKIEGVSFYSSTLKEKSLYKDYFKLAPSAIMEKNICNLLSIWENDIVDKKVLSLFLCGFDFYKYKSNSEKIYLKVKNPVLFQELFFEKWNFFPRNPNSDELKLSCVGFKGFFEHRLQFNFYYKPIR